MIEYAIVLIKGFSTGFLLAMMVGPISLFCIQQTLHRGFYAGFAAGLGAATADGIYGAIAGFGLTIIGNFLHSQALLLQLAGGGFLIYLGIQTFCKARPEPLSANLGKKDLLGLYSTTLFLTLANPITIIGFTALLSSIGIDASGSGSTLALLLFTGVFIGSTIWWLILTGSLSTLRTRISMNLIHKLNKIAGAAIACFGLLVFLRALPAFIR